MSWLIRIHFQVWSSQLFADNGNCTLGLFKDNNSTMLCSELVDQGLWGVSINWPSLWKENHVWKETPKTSLNNICARVSLIHSDLSFIYFFLKGFLSLSKLLFFVCLKVQEWRWQVIFLSYFAKKFSLYIFKASAL